MNFRVLMLTLLSGTAVMGAGQPLTWENCLDLAARNNPSLVAARARTEAAAAGIDVARAALLPQLSAGATASQGSRGASAGGDGQDAGSGSTGSGGEGTTYNAAATVEQSLYSGGKNKANVRVAQATLALTGANAGSLRAQLTYDLRAAYINLLYAQERVQLFEAITNRRKDNFELVDLRYEGGREHKGSLAMSEASLYEAQIQLKQANRMVSVNSRILSRTIGLEDSAASLVVTGRLVSGELPGLTNLNVMASGNSSYSASVAAVGVAAAQVESARGALRPDLSLTGSGGRTGGEAAASDENEWTVGVKLSVPIWSGGKTQYALRKARAALAESEANRADMLNTLARNLAESYQTFDNALEAVAVEGKYVEAAELRAEISRQQYEDGLLTFENWSVIEDELITKRKLLIESRRAAMTAEAAWWLATGNEFIAAAGAAMKGGK